MSRNVSFPFAICSLLGLYLLFGAFFVGVLALLLFCIALLDVYSWIPGVILLAIGALVLTRRIQRLRKQKIVLGHLEDMPRPARVQIVGETLTDPWPVSFDEHLLGETPGRAVLLFFDPTAIKRRVDRPTFRRFWLIPTLFIWAGCFLLVANVALWLSR